MLGADIAAALPELRIEAESLMVDSCTITRAGASGVIDEDTGIVGTDTASEVYSGKCRFRPPSVQPKTTDAGETEWSLAANTLQLPASVTGVQIGDEVTGASTLNPDIAGRTFTVTGVEQRTHATMRRVSLEEVS